MWILAVLFWRRPRLAQNLVIGWLLLMGTELSVIAPGQLWLRAVNPGSPYIYPVDERLLVAAAVAGPVAVMTAVVFLLARWRRDERDRRPGMSSRRRGLPVAADWPSVRGRPTQPEHR